MPMILTTTAIYPLSISWTRAPSSSSSSSSSTRDTIRTTSFIRKPPSLLSLAFLSIVDATTRLARKRKRERKSGKKSSKKSSLFCGVSHSSKALSRFKKKRGINPTPSSRRRRRARDRDPTKPTPFVRDDSFPFREFLEKANVSLFCRRRRRATFLSSSADVFFSAQREKIPSSSTHHHHKRAKKKGNIPRRKKKQSKSSSQSSETDATRPRATYHERNRFRRFCLHRGIDGFLHSFGEVVRFDVLLDRHISLILR